MPDDRAHRPFRLGRISKRSENRNEFLRGPKWRTRTSPPRRAKAALITFSIVAAVGLVVVAGIIWSLGAIGAPTWLSVLPWLAPMLGALTWVVVRPSPAVATDDDDDSWVGFAIRYVMIGENEPRSVPARVIAAAVLGAPVVWALGVFGLLSIVGLM